MNPAPTEIPGHLLTFTPAEGGRTRVEVDPRSAQSLIRFLLEKQLRLDPPEGGVARDPKYQVEMAGVPERHGFFVFASAEQVRSIANEWWSSGTRAGLP